MTELTVKLTLTEELLGTNPSNPDVHVQYIASKAEDALKVAEEVAAHGV